jgi:hypothetical protein
MGGWGGCCGGAWCCGYADLGDGIRLSWTGRPSDRGLLVARKGGGMPLGGGLPLAPAEGGGGADVDAEGVDPPQFGLTTLTSRSLVAGGPWD